MEIQMTTTRIRDILALIGNSNIQDGEYSIDLEELASIAKLMQSSAAMLELLGELTGLSDEAIAFMLKNRDNLKIVKNPNIASIIMAQVVEK